VSEDRRGQLSAALDRLRERIAAACHAAGRDPAQLHPVAVTKSFPADDVRLLAELGVTDVGENRAAEAAEKRAACHQLRLRWHFVGQLQRNKVRLVAAHADVVHSVDRVPLAVALGRAAAEQGRPLAALVQVDLDPVARPGRGGARPEDVAALADAVAATDGLTLAGLMAVAPLGLDPDAAFARLAALADQVRTAHPGARMVSAGMSGDLEAAIRHGATHPRIGTALLGQRGVAVG
jgi:pyridoxal phosphate enzyme (YggS family)